MLLLMLIFRWLNANIWRYRSSIVGARKPPELIKFKMAANKSSRKNAEVIVAPKNSRWSPMWLPITSAVPRNQSRQQQFPGIDDVSCSRELMTSAVLGNRSRQQQFPGSDHARNKSLWALSASILSWDRVFFCFFC